MVCPFTLEETARRLGHCRWVEMRAFEVMGGWVTSVPQPEVTAHLGAHARHHGWHAGLWADLMAATGTLGPERLTVPASDAVAALLVALDEPGPEETVERLVGLYRILLPRKITAYTTHLAVATPVADAPLVRALGIVLRDEIEDWSGGEALLQSLLTSAESVRRATSWQARLETLLAPAVGVVGPGPGEKAPEQERGPLASNQQGGSGPSGAPVPGGA